MQGQAGTHLHLHAVIWLWLAVKVLCSGVCGDTLCQAGAGTVEGEPRRASGPAALVDGCPSRAICMLTQQIGSGRSSRAPGNERPMVLLNPLRALGQ